MNQEDNNNQETTTTEGEVNETGLEQTTPTVADDEVLLTDGRIVKMRETTGADEAAVAQMLGAKVNLQGAGTSVLIQANALKSIVSIDGKDAPIMRSYNDFLSFSRTFTSKNLNRILKKYMALNMEADANNPLA